MDENQNNVPEVLPAILTSDKLLAIAEQAEKRVEALQKIKLIALRTTNVRDWTDHSGKPWLQESGATKVGRLFGVSWNIVGPELETYEDGHFNYTYQGIFSLADISIEAIGSRQSKDGFFNTRYKWDDTKKKNMPHDLPPSEIDKGDVKKAAWANCLARGITTILGIKNLTWEEIEEHTNLRKDQVTHIQYKKGKDKGKSPQPSPKSQNGAKDQRKNVYEGKPVGDPNIFIHCPKHGREILKKACLPCDERKTCDSWATPKAEDPSTTDEAPPYKGTKRVFAKWYKDNESTIPGMDQEHQDRIKAEFHRHYPGQPYPLDEVPEEKDEPANGKPEDPEDEEAKILRLVEDSEIDGMGVALVPCPDRDKALIKFTMCNPCMYKRRVGCPTWENYDSQVGE